MVVDYEQAWSRLQEAISQKTQHGREGLLIEMAEIQAACRVPAGELSRLLRLYGVEVDRARRELQDTDTSSGGDEVADGTGSDLTTIGGRHGGEHNGREAAGAR